MTQATDLPNVLAAESLLLTLLTFIYGLLYPELAGAERIELGGRQFADVGPDRARVRAARQRAGALAIVAIIIGGVFTPSSLHAAWHFLRRLPKGVSAFDHYNTVATTLVLVTAGCFVLAGHALWMVRRLSKTLGRLSPPER
jgi:hypothetical protein